MNTLGIALIWCIVQVTLMSLLASGLYLLLRRFRPAAAAPIVMAGLAMVVVLSLLTFSPWPRWNFYMHIQSADESPLASGASSGDSREGNDSFPGADRLNSASDEASIDASPDADFDATKTAITPSAEDKKTPSPEKHNFLQSLAESLSRPQAAGLTSGWRWPEIAAVVLLTAMGLGFLWLVLGVFAVRRQRHRSRPVEDRSLTELIDVLRAELGCVRPIEVRQSDELVTAATIGWRRPVLLLPADWTSWTADQCRAVLAHEIAHARSHDFLALLCGQLGLMLHFYHPIVHWLVNRLRLEQELAADAAAASISGGQRQYLTTIAELALRQQDRPLSWPARTFLPTRNTFLRRIAMLRDSKLHFDRLSPTARTLTVSVIVLGGLLFAGLRGPAGPKPAMAEETPISVKEKGNISENILANSGMEKGEAYAEDWLQGNSVEGVKYSWDKNVASEGKASLCIEKTVNRFFPIAGWSQTVDRTGDLPFLEVSAQVKTKKMFKAVLDVIFLDKNDQWISHEWAAYIGSKENKDPPANHDWKKYTGIVKIPEGTAKITIGLQDYGPGTVWFDDVQARYVENKSTTPASTDKIVEGIGWGKVRVGMSRHDLIEALGNPDDDPSSDILRWKKKNIDCTFHTGSKVVSEVRFNPGFQGALANGIKVGSPASMVEEFYGDKPNHTINRNNGAKEYEYSDKGILLWTYRDKITQIVVFQPYVKKENKPSTDSDVIKEGIGWGKLRIGMSREDLYEAIGKPDNDPASDYPRWNKLNIECSLQPGSTHLTEIRFNPGFEGALANGVKLGSPADNVEKFYGDKPNQIYKRDNGAENHEYLDKGIMLWTYQGKITQIIVMKPATAEASPPATQEISAKTDEPEKSAAPSGKMETLSYVGESSTDMMSWADSGYAVLFERPADLKSINAVKLYGARYGMQKAPNEKFHIYLLDEKQKVLEHILVPYGKVQRGDMKWHTFEFPAVEVPQKFFVAFWFDAEATKGVYVGKDKNVTESHSWSGLPDKGYHKAEENYDWMIRAEVSDDNGKKPTYPKVKTYEDENAADEEIGEVSAKRIWNDSSGAFSLEAEFGGVKDGKVSLKKADGKTITLPLDKLSKEDQDFVAKQAETKKSSADVANDKTKELSHDDGKMASKSSIAGGGHAVRFEVDSDSYYVTSVSLHGSRYGTPRPPEENFNVWICDENFKPIATFHFPYGSYARAAPAWKSFKVKPTKVPQKFIVCFGFNPQQTKGVFVSYDAEGSGNSLVGVPGQSEPSPFEKGDWLIRCKVEKR
jgi:beta-lactamase regulating signal transducer with metallopeptidase domain